ncbi:MAG: response regulator [Bacteroidales bacterium]|nr:response regulator [Bacteroidales bacterium]MBN2821006.1 response regulator [Bacteroidales bacterium]
MGEIKNKKILIVEDDDMNYIYLKQIFKILGGDITRVKNGNSAIQTFKESEFDLVLMDLQLPDISGYEVTKLIRNINSEIPIVAQTASKTPEEHYEAIQSGCNYVLPKPYKIDDIKSILNKIFD